jgi:hypothetical protein
MRNGKYAIGATASAAALVTFVVFLRALSGGFLNYDDADFVQLNSAIQKLDINLISYAFGTIPSFSGIWTPLVWISFTIDYHFWGMNPLGFHLTNILLHVANTSLVVLIANRLYRSELAKSFSLSVSSKQYLGMLLLAGLLFGIHPLRVESVAWISERKDVLNGVFTLSSILFYLRYVQCKDLNCGYRSSRCDYTLSLLFLMCSIMSKPVSVVTPLILLVLDWYPLNRLCRETIRSVLVEKIPYFVLMTAMITLTLYMGAEEGGLLVSSEAFTFSQRLATSGNALFEYVRLMLYPIGILPIHLLATPIPYSYTVKTAAVILVLVYFCFSRKRSWQSATLLCFLLPIVPVLAFFQTNSVAFAARYTYLPSVIPSVAVAAIIATLYNKSTAWAAKYYIRLFVTCITLLLLIFYGVMTQRLISVWKNSETFWTRQITYQPFDKAYFLRAVYYMASGKFMAAVEDYTACLEIAVKEKMPDEFVVNIIAFRGEALTKAGYYKEAVQDLSFAIAMKPQPTYFYHRGLALQGLGKLEEAQGDFSKAGSKKSPMRWF